MKIFAFILFFIIMLQTSNAIEAQWVLVDSNIWSLSEFSKKRDFKAIPFSKEGVSLVRLFEDEREELSHEIHDRFKRCGGMTSHDERDEALEVIENLTKFASIDLPFLKDKELNQTEEVLKLIGMIDRSRLIGMINNLTNFNNRHYKSKTGEEATEYIHSTWTEMVKNRSDISVEFFKHENFPQKSVIATIKGQTTPDEIIIIGGHADSIASSWMGGSTNARAPGADDNASGITVVTEALRIAAESGFKPQKTIQFMAYAGEEAGLLGSKDIANSYKRKNMDVKGKIQFDMTLHKGTASLDIVLMSDFTNKDQNLFLGRLIDEYIKVPWGFSKCGYACSDHASWSNLGFAASMPFEAKMEDSNKKIHSASDTIDVARGAIEQVEKFSKLAISYMVESSD